MTRRQLLATAALAVPTLALSGAAQSGPNWFEFLGPVDDFCPEVRTPRYGILLATNGFNEGREKWFHPWKKNGKVRPAKTVKYLLDQGADHLVEPFVNLASSMQDPEGLLPAHGFMATTVDIKFDEVRDKWLACGGRFATAVRAYDPSRLRIDVAAAPIWSTELNQWLAGVTWSPTRVQVVCVTADLIRQDGPHATLRGFPSLVAWEIGNAVAWSAGIGSADQATEVGSGSPCGR